MLLGTLSLTGCKSLTLVMVKVVDTDQNSPAANRAFRFIETPAGIVQSFVQVELSLDTNGEASVRLRPVSYWARIDEAGSVMDMGTEHQLSPLIFETEEHFGFLVPHPLQVIQTCILRNTCLKFTSSDDARNCVQAKRHDAHDDEQEL